MNTMTSITTTMIHLSQEDFRRLRQFAAASPKNGASHGPSTLRAELARANVLARELLPPGVVTVNSRVRFKDVESGEVEQYIITWPDRADGGVERISVLAPIGTALLGYREGDEISWPTPGGTRRLQILDVEPVADESLVDPKEDALAQLLSGRR